MVVIAVAVIVAVDVDAVLLGHSLLFSPAVPLLAVVGAVVFRAVALVARPSHSVFFFSSPIPTGLSPLLLLLQLYQPRGAPVTLGGEDGYRSERLEQILHAMLGKVGRCQCQLEL